MKLSQVKEYVTGVLKQWFTNKPILDKFNETETGELLYGTKTISSNPVLKYQKYLNTELDYAQVRFPGDTTVNNVAVGTIIPFSKVMISNNIEYDTSTYIFKLKAGKAYKVLSSIRTLNSSGYFYFCVYNKTKNCTHGVAGCAETPSTYNNNVVNTTAYAIIECDVDTEVQVKITSIDKSRTIIFTGLSTVIVEEINRQIIIDPVEHVNTEQGLEDTPVGHIMPHTSITAPKHYLICDGAEYNIEDYPYLAQHFINEFGSASYFGGDGITTFAVPLKDIGYVKIPITNIDNIFVDSLYSTKFPGRHAFDGSISTSWAAASSSSVHYIGYDFKKPTKLFAYSITIRNYNTSDITESPAQWMLQGSNDGNEWVDIAEQRFSFSAKEQIQIFKLASPVIYSQYRLYNIIPSSGNVVSIGELDFYAIEQINCIKYEPTYYTNVYNPLVGRSETVLFEGNYSESNNSNTLTTGITLNDSIENYNELYVEAMYENSGSKIYGHLTTYIKINSLIGHYGYPTIELFCTNGTSDCLVRINCGFIDDKTLSIGWINESVNWHSPYISKIIGVKYQEAQLENNTDKDINSAIAEAVAEINEEV